MAGLVGATRAADDAKTLAARIDSRLDAALREAGVQPAGMADDAEYLRRVTLDLVGRIPTVAEVRSFLDDKAADKRARLVDRLLASPSGAHQSAQTLRSFLLPQASSNPQLQHLAVSLEAWLRQQYRDGRHYDQIVRDLLTAPLDYHDQPASGPGKAPPAASPLAFYEANDLKAETVASSADRLFLGVKIECAQCHDHPFDKWTRNQFWESAAFFAGVPPVQLNETRPKGDDGPLALRRSLTIPELNKTVSAKYLDGREPDWKKEPDPRRTFAAWATARDNTYFARTGANRIWANLFGVGLVDPIDDFGPHNLPSHPELLDDLAAAFAASGYDEKLLVKAITQSSAYGRTSRASSASQDDPRIYARMNVKGLSPEQLFDSVALATGYREAAPPAARAVFGYGKESPRGQFMATFGGGSQRSDRQTSILQALALLNGDWIARQTDPEQGAVLKAVLDAPFLDDAGRIETLYLAALGRKPRSEETRRLIVHLKEGGDGDRRKAFGDLFWALLNSNEFLVNH
jgi:hypothetical protein